MPRGLPKPKNNAQRIAQQALRHHEAKKKMNGSLSEAVKKRKKY